MREALIARRWDLYWSPRKIKAQSLHHHFCFNAASIHNRINKDISPFEVNINVVYKTGIQDAVLYDL